MCFRKEEKSLDKSSLQKTSDMGTLSKFLLGLIESDLANFTLESLVALCDASLTSGIDLTSNQVIQVFQPS